MKLTLVRYDDWEGIYMGDNLMFEDHKIRPVDLLQLLKDINILNDVDIIDIDNKIMEECGYSFPNDLNDIKSSL